LVEREEKQEKEALNLFIFIPYNTCRELNLSVLIIKFLISRKARFWVTNSFCSIKISHKDQKSKKAKQNKRDILTYY